MVIENREVAPWIIRVAPLLMVNGETGFTLKH
jgi:hypothetical protein